MIKRLMLILLLVSLVFGGVFGLKFRQIQEDKKNMKPPPPAVVAVTRVKQVSWQPYLSTVGSMVAVSGIYVSNEIAGKVSAIRFRSGQTIKQGDMLVELDTSTDLAELNGLLASQRLAQIRFQRRKKLLTNNSVSKSEYDEARALLDEARSAVQAKRALIDKKQIQAPFSGMLGIRQVDIGQYLAPGSPIVTLQALDPIYADFSLPERHLSSLKQDLKVEVHVQAYTDQIFNGHITALNSGVDEGTRTVKVRATLQNPGQLLHPGMFAEIKILLSGKKTVLTLPDTAITFNPYGDSVFVVIPGDHGLTVQRRQIETGERRQGRVEIRAGLHLNERVVSAGQIKLRNGMRVTLDNKPYPGGQDNRT
ncbi:MAG: efflux RND transporter periplasmic adaptor subunit [Gammaproteobacteria bacterium]